jgi:hypothetical protein
MEGGKKKGCDLVMGIICYAMQNGKHIFKNNHSPM